MTEEFEYYLSWNECEVTEPPYMRGQNPTERLRPVGEGKYAIVKHQNHAELAYILEMPKEPGEAQKELGIEKEASYIISVINPKRPAPTGYPSTKEQPKYPQEVLKEFNETENFVSLANKDTKFIDYQTLITSIISID